MSINMSKRSYKDKSSKVSFNQSPAWTPYGVLNPNNAVKELKKNNIQDVFEDDIAFEMAIKFQDLIHDNREEGGYFESDYFKARQLFANPVEFYKSINDKNDKGQFHGKNKKAQETMMGQRKKLEDLKQSRATGKDYKEVQSQKVFKDKLIFDNHEKEMGEMRRQKTKKLRALEQAAKDLDEQDAIIVARGEVPKKRELQVNFESQQKVPSCQSSEFEPSFYGPIDDDIEHVSESSEEPEVVNNQSGGYMSVKEEFKHDQDYKFREDDICNKVRWKILTFDGIRGNGSKFQQFIGQEQPEIKTQTALHLAASAGLKDFSTMIVLEARFMGVVKKIIDIVDANLQTPLYSLCQTGHWGNLTKPQKERLEIEMKSYEERDNGGHTQREKWCFDDVIGTQLLQYSRGNMNFLIDEECQKPSRAYLVKLLIENGANPNKVSQGVFHCPIHWLCYWGDWRATKVLLKMNSLDKISDCLEPPGLFGKMPTYETFLEQHGAFNMMQTMDEQTPCDIAGDMENYRTVCEIIKYFMQETEQRKIINNFTHPDMFEQYGQQRFPQQKTKEIEKRDKLGFLRIHDFLGKLGMNEFHIAFAKSTKNLNPIQQSYLKVAYWAIFIYSVGNIDDLQQKNMAKQFVYIFIMDLGISPFIKCYDGKSLISATVHSKQHEFFKELLGHTYVCGHESDYMDMIKRCAKTRNILGNNLMHDICQLPDGLRNKYLKIVHETPVRIVKRLLYQEPPWWQCCKGRTKIKHSGGEEAMDDETWVSAGSLATENRHAIFPHEMVHRQPMLMEVAFVNDSAGMDDSNKAEVNVYERLKQLHCEQFEADFCIVIKKNKQKFIQAQFDDLQIYPYNEDTDKPIPQMKRSVYFKFETKPKDHHWFRSFVETYAPESVGLYKWLGCFKFGKSKRNLKKKKIEAVEAEEEDEMLIIDRDSDKLVYYAIKMCATDIDQIAHTEKVFADIKENIKAKFNKLISDQYIAFDQRVYQFCVKQLIERQLDLVNLQQSGVVEAYYPLHKERESTRVVQALGQRSGLCAKRSLIVKTLSKHKVNQTIHSLESIHMLKRYSGEQFSFYYLFLNHFLAYLTIPAILSIVFTIWQLYYFENIAPKGSVNLYEGFMDSEYSALFGILIALWSTFFIETWKKREQALIFEWDLAILRENTTEEIRKNFKFVLKYDSDINEKIKTRPRDTSKYEQYNWIFLLVLFTLQVLAQFALQGYEMEQDDVKQIPDFMGDRNLQNLDYMQFLVDNDEEQLEKEIKIQQDIQNIQQQEKQMSLNLARTQNFGTKQIQSSQIKRLDKVKRDLVNQGKELTNSLKNKVIETYKALAEGFYLKIIMWVFDKVHTIGKEWLITKQNFKYEQDQQNQVAVQSFLFRFWNTYFPFIYAAMVTSNPYFQLVSMILYQLIPTFLATIQRMILLCVEKRRQSNLAHKHRGVAGNNEVLYDKVQWQVIKNRKLLPTQNTILGINQDYSDIAMLFGLITLFSNVSTQVSIIVFIIVWIKMKTVQEEFRFKRRLLPKLSFGIGPKFLMIFDGISHLSVFVNCLIAYKASQRTRDLFVDGREFAPGYSFNNTKVHEYLGTIVIGEHLLIFVKMIIAVYYSHSQSADGKGRKLDERLRSRTVIRGQHAVREDRRVEAYKHAQRMTALKLIEWQESQGEFLIKTVAKVEKKVDQVRKINYMKYSTKLPPIVNLDAENRRQHRVEFEVYPDRDAVSEGENEGLVQEVQNQRTEFFISFKQAAKLKDDLGN